MIEEAYMEEARRTDAGSYEEGGALYRRLGENGALLHYVMGVVTEAGELMDAVKKATIYGKPLDKVNLLEELGDLQWYEARLLDLLGSSFARVRALNALKLRKRYPDGYSDKAAALRDTGGERDLLQGQLPPCGHPSCAGFMGCTWAYRKSLGIEEPEPYRVQPTGFHEAPAHYAGEREAIDVLRDEFGDEAFAIGCDWNARKYELRAGKKGDPKGDEEKATWYRLMADHVRGYGPDPRAHRPNFQPYRRKGQ